MHRPFCYILMTLAENLQQAKQKLTSPDDFLAAEVLLAFAIGKSREYLIAHADEQISPSHLADFEDLFQRFLGGEPVAYLTHVKEFYGLDFYVDKRVLIPRPETELLVEKVIEIVNEDGLGTFQKTFQPVRILDIGTGSGCIAISLAKHLPQAIIQATDISEEALEVAKLNAQNLKLTNQPKFFQSNLLQNVEQPADIIVANLPYIGTERFAFVSKNARDFEPHVALFGGKDGLFLYEQLFQQLNEKPWKPQILLGEFGFLQTEELTALIKKYFPEAQLNFAKDYAHIDRIFMVKFPHAR